jgi:hypothetical protein
LQFYRKTPENLRFSDRLLEVEEFWSILYWPNTTAEVPLAP